ncbi:MAG: hypothetical protein M3169_18055 [Candidatus Eremiobacteraeota bacterium]|nr:hypothetical protein [Candidatus Eremiobacteraeota bacterium]
MSPFQMHFERRQLGGYEYAFLFVKKLPTAVLDFWHKTPEREPFISGNTAMERFKAGDERAAVAFSRALGAIAGEFRNNRIDYVVPLIESDATRATRDTPVGRLAVAAARTLGAEVNVDIFRQTPRRTLHGGEVLNYDERYEIVHENLTIRGTHRGTRILLVDDVVSSGATTSAYRDRFGEAGGTACAVLGVMKFAQEQPLLNPDIYPPLAV